MKAKILIAMILLALVANPICAADDAYTNVRGQSIKLYKAGKYKDAAKILEKNFDRFPEHATAMGWNLAITYMKLENFKKGLATMKHVHKMGKWFNIWMLKNPALKPFRTLKGFSRLVARNEELRAQVQATAKPVLKIIEPEGFDKENKYPLFIALHGGGGNLEGFMLHLVSNYFFNIALVRAEFKIKRGPHAQAGMVRLVVRVQFPDVLYMEELPADIAARNRPRPPRLP